MIGKLVFKSGTKKALSKILLCLSSLFSSVLVFPSLSVQEWRLPETRTAFFLPLCALSGSDSFPTFNLSVSHSIQNLINTTSSSILHTCTLSPSSHSSFSTNPLFFLLRHSSPFNPHRRLWSKAGFAWCSRILMWVTFKIPPLGSYISSC